MRSGMNVQRRKDPAQPAETIVGRVAEIWRYPVQSMGGEGLAATTIQSGGIPGDRAYGLVDPDIGEIVSSAQGKKKWRGIVALSARLLAEPQDDPVPIAEITLPDGTTLLSDRADIDARLTAALGAPVHLAHRATESKRAAYEHEPLHILTTASLAAFKAHHAGGRFEPARFRPNIVVDTGDGAGFVEQGWLVRQLRIGEGLRIAVTDHCKRCVMTTLAQGDLPFDPAILHTVTASNNTFAGVYASVAAPGPIRIGDPVALSEDP